MSEGYVRLFFGAVLIYATIWFLNLKIRSLSYILDGYSRKVDIHIIELIQRNIRYYLSIIIALCVGVVIISIATMDYLISLFHWLSFTFPDVADGYEAGKFVLVNLLKLLALLVATAFMLLVAIISGFIVFCISFVFFVFGSLIQIPFIVHFIMTGVYVSPNWINIEYSWIPIAIGIVSFTLSDIADISIFLMDKLSAYN